MTFAWPQLLWLLLFPLALAVRELAGRRRAADDAHPRIARGEAGLNSVSLAPEGSPPVAGRRPRLWLCAGLALSVVALARPQWGRLDEPVFDQSREIVIALDLSRSMLTPDVKPSRLERAKLLVQSLLDRLKGERVGLIVFSGTAFLQSPLSADYEILREFLPALGPDFLPEGGTNYGQLIETALDAFGSGAAADRYLIILSDGEATDENWRERVPALKERGIRVIGLGVGTASGGMIPDGSGGFMKDQSGAVVMSKLEAGTLRDLADATGGAFREASSWVDLASLLQSTVELGRKGRFVEHNSVRYAERLQWALAPALLCLIASFWREFPVRPRERELRLAAPRTLGGTPSSAAAAGARAAALALIAAFALHPRPARAQADSGDRAPSAGLSRIVGRLSAKENCSALDWSELARETVNWGDHLQSAREAVPEGPVRDALQAVADGAKMDPNAADWTDLRSKLEALLNPQEQQQKPEDQKQNQNQQQNQNQDQKDQDQKQQDQKQQDQKQDQQNQNSSSSQNGKQDQQKQNEQQQRSSSQQPQQQNPPPSPDKAFGDMKDKQPPPQEKGQTQSVGGAQKQPDDPAAKVPALAVPLEKLQQLRDKDSPAELFGLLRKDEPPPPPDKSGKNW